MARRAGSLVASLLASMLAIASIGGCASPAGPAPNAVREAASSLSQNAGRAQRRGELNRALQLYTLALAKAESIEDFDAAGAILLNLALVHAGLGQLPAAHAQVDRILAAPQRYGPELHARAAARKALLYLDARDFDAALLWAQAAQAECPQRCGLDAALLNVRAYVALERNDPDAAAALATSAAQLSSAPGQEAEQANALRLLGRAHTRAGRTEPAADALARALQIDRTLGLPNRVALDLLYAGENEERRSDGAAARDFYERALTVYAAAGNRKAAQILNERLNGLREAPATTQAR